MLFASLDRKGRLNIDEALSNGELAEVYQTLRDVNDTIGQTSTMR